MNLPHTSSPKHVRNYFLAHLLRFQGEALLSNLRGIDTRIGFAIETDREVFRFSLALRDGVIESVEEDWNGEPEIVYRTGEETFWKVVGGLQRAESAFLRGRIKIRGHLLRGLKLAFLLQEFFDRFPYPPCQCPKYDAPEEREEREWERLPEDVIEERALIGEDFSIKAVYQEDLEPVFSAILIPPHPFLGGTSENELLIRVSSALASAGGFIVRFDYRETLESRDSVLSFWEDSDAGYRLGVEELRAIHGWMKNQEFLSEIPLLWIGYSYGAQVCLWSLESVSPDKTVLISPVVSQIGEERFNLGPETLLIGAAEDFATTAPEFHDFTRTTRTAHPPRMIPGADHFYAKREKQVIDAILDFLAAPVPTVTEEAK